MLDFLTGDSVEAHTLRERCVFKIIPMLNPDGKKIIMMLTVMFIITILLLMQFIAIVIELMIMIITSVLIRSDQWELSYESLRL